MALLTIAGFSVHDTVVIYDRVRENLQLTPNRPINDLVDDSVRQTLTRSLNTVFAILLTLVTLFLFGGATLKNFALALIMGFTMGAYSNIFVASPLFAWWRSRKSSQSKLKPGQESSLPDRERLLIISSSKRDRKIFSRTYRIIMFYNLT